MHYDQDNFVELGTNSRSLSKEHDEMGGLLV